MMMMVVMAAAVLQAKGRVHPFELGSKSKATLRYHLFAMAYGARIWELSWASDRHLRLALAASAHGQAREHVRRAYARLAGANITNLLDTTPAYTTLLLRFDLLGLDAERTERVVLATLESSVPGIEPSPTRLTEIPICYHAACAPDIAALGARHGFDAERVAELHASSEYLVEFIGFAPGFPYLAGLPAGLATPRLARPRVHVAPGSVGIAGGQCGIYPRATAGGWNLIGRTPLDLFDPAATPPNALSLGDRVRFVPITLDEFRAQGGTVQP